MAADVFLDRITEAKNDCLLYDTLAYSVARGSRLLTAEWTGTCLFVKILFSLLDALVDLKNFNSVDSRNYLLLLFIRG